MYRIFREGTGHFIEIKDTDTSEGIANIIPLSAPPQPPPDDFKYSKDGTYWIAVDLAIAVTGGVFRYSTSSLRKV